FRTCSDCCHRCVIIGAYPAQASSFTCRPFQAIMLRVIRNFNLSRCKQKGALMQLSVFIGASVDGFIARHNGTYDFLNEGGNIPHGFDEFFATIDTLVIGRGTFETVLAFPEWPYAKKRVVVLSSRHLDLSAVPATVEQMSGAPAEIAARLAA